MARNLKVGTERNRRGVIIPINGVVREVPIGPHTVARFYVQPEREEHFECALCGLPTTTNRQPILGFSFCQGHDARSRVVAVKPPTLTSAFKRETRGRT